MRRLGRVRVPFFAELLARPVASPAVDGERDIVRRPGNPLLRYRRAAAPIPFHPPRRPCCEYRDRP